MVCGFPSAAANTFTAANNNTAPCRKFSKLCCYLSKVKLNTKIQQNVCYKLKDYYYAKLAIYILYDNLRKRKKKLIMFPNSNLFL